MNKRQSKKTQVEKLMLYRGIRLWQGWAGKYSYLQRKDTKVMILLPSIVNYAPDFTIARKLVDDWHQSSEAYKYKHERKHNLSAPF